MSGPYHSMSRYGHKTWSGEDDPPLPKVYQTYLVRKDKRIVWVYKGKEQVKLIYRSKIRKYRVRPPKRARSRTSHAYNVTVSRVTDDVEFRWRGNPYQDFVSCYAGQNGGFPIVSQTWTANDDLRLISKLREKIGGSSFNAGIMLGEGREALQSITNAATRIYWGYRAARQGDFRSARRYLVHGNDRKKLEAVRSPASNWLELQYAWLPLLADAQEGAEFLAHHLELPRVVKVKATAKTVGSMRPQNFAMQYGSTEVYTRKTVYAELSEVNVAKLAGLTDPLSVAWELVPYSFVVDWFIPIGSFLAARGLASSIEGRFVTGLKTLSLAKGIKGGVMTVYGPSEIQQGVVNTEFLSMTYSRSSPQPMLRVPTPNLTPLNQVFGWTRAANAVALLVGLTPRADRSA